MAAYAAVTSLLQSLDQLSQTDHSSYSVLYKKDQTEVLSEKYTFLKAFLEDFTNVFHEDIKMKHLERMIQEAAHGVEDTIDSHVYDSLVFLQSRRERRKANTIFHKNLEYAIEEIGLIQREVTKKIKFSRFNSKISHSRDTSSQFPLDQKDMIVGLDEDLLKIKDRLIVQSSRLEVVPIVGMGGIGKTTLARRVYDDSLITYHFYVRAWISVSQEFDRRDIFLGILQSISTVNDEVERNSTTEQLAERVYRSLKGRKYLILLDDMWSIEPWQHVRRSFPDDHNGSRIVLTTRLVDVASSASSANSLHQMRFLSMEESWTLLRDKVFGNDSYPPELEKIGRYIGHQCQGLPLAVVAIGGLLSKMRKETSSWENVAEKVGSLMTSDSMDCLSILSLSYNHLPPYLKPCFLYIGVFAETREIPVWKLIKLWIAEGFIKKVKHKNLEGVAEETLRELVDRSLVLVGKHSSVGKIKTCKMHDLVRDMCLREAQSENFIHFKTRYGHDSLLENIDCLRRVVDFNKYTHSGLSEFMPLTRTVFFKYPYNLLCLPLQSSFRLLRILDVCFTTSIFYSSESISELVHLRYFACPSYDGLVQSICNLPNIQTIVIHDKSPRDMFIRTHPLAWEVLDMPQLRHIHNKNFSLLIPQPTSLFAERENHLQTLTGLMPSSCNVEVFQRIPNLKKLGILNVDSVATSEKCSCLDNLVHLTQLEKLKVEFRKDYMHHHTLWRTADRVYIPRLHIPHYDNFPPKLKKLTLCKTHLQWEEMNFLRKLPNLEVLKLKDRAFHGEIWRLSEEDEEGFFRLKFLLLESMYLEQWEATSYHFPSLEHLVLTDCYSLEQIPFDFADIQTLQLIELHKCMHSVLVSAEQIQEEQQSLGNDDLVIRVNYIHKKIT
ncbi:putative late blight resistance protein R1A-10 isoform X1 [Capsicum annuum]|uniref:putative late blight resistance protein homolog R1A-10 isoform X1 n=1 Tax=Capsicum annuum TaxID=4072 RepID=UPI001FB0C8B9|nr:putative late blight resistance protein homolog R1A-10 isoform X1 [Capsicum annuum]